MNAIFQKTIAGITASMIVSWSVFPVLAVSEFTPYADMLVKSGIINAEISGA